MEFPTGEQSRELMKVRMYISMAYFYTAHCEKTFLKIPYFEITFFLETWVIKYPLFLGLKKAKPRFKQQQKKIVLLIKPCFG